MERKQASRGSVILWTMFCWETLGPGIHLKVPLTGSTYLKSVTDQVHPRWTVLANGTGLFQLPGTLQKWFRNRMRNIRKSSRPPHYSDLNPWGTFDPGAGLLHFLTTANWEHPTYPLPDRCHCNDIIHKSLFVIYDGIFRRKHNSSL